MRILKIRDKAFKGTYVSKTLSAILAATIRAVIRYTQKEYGLLMKYD